MQPSRRWQPRATRPARLGSSSGTRSSSDRRPRSFVHSSRDRRVFLSRLTRLGFVALAPGALPLLRISEAAAAPLPGSLAETTGPDPATLVREAVAKLGGMARFVRPGQTVA